MGPIHIYGYYTEFGEELCAACASAEVEGYYPGTVEWPSCTDTETGDPVLYPITSLDSWWEGYLDYARDYATKWPYVVDLNCSGCNVVLDSVEIEEGDVS